MKQSFYILIFAALLNLTFGQTTTNASQATFTKKLFYNLPIDQSKDKVISSIKADTNTFKIFAADPLNPERIYAEAKQKNKILPKTTYNPTVSTHDVKVYVDSIYKYSYTEISIKYIYYSIFKRRKAKKAYKILIKNMTPEFSGFLDLKSASKRSYFHLYNVIRQRKFYSVSNPEPICTLQLVDNEKSGSWQVIITYIY